MHVKSLVLGIIILNIETLNPRIPTTKKMVRSPYSYLPTSVYWYIAWSTGCWQQSARLSCPGLSFPAVSVIAFSDVRFKVHASPIVLGQAFLPCALWIPSPGDQFSDCVADPSPSFLLYLFFCRYLFWHPYTVDCVECSEWFWTQPMRYVLCNTAELY